MTAFQPSPILGFALERWSAYPQMQIQDAYKWLYQATRGGEHATLNFERAAKLLETEWQAADDASENEMLWEPLTPNAAIGRLHLRPFKNKAGDITDLLNAFLNSVKVFSGDADHFIACWNELGDVLAEQSDRELSKNEWKALNEKMLTADFPAISHSEQYKKTYRPSYRILALSEFEKLIESIKT